MPVAITDDVEMDFWGHYFLCYRFSSFLWPFGKRKLQFKQYQFYWKCDSEMCLGESIRVSLNLYTQDTDTGTSMYWNVCIEMNCIVYEICGHTLPSTQRCWTHPVNCPNILRVLLNARFDIQYGLLFEKGNNTAKCRCSIKKCTLL